MSSSNISKVNPYYVSGFLDGESCFFISIRKNNKYKLGFSVQVVFKISLHKRELALLERIQSTFGGIGKVSKQSKDSIQFQVTSLEDLAIIIEHLDKYPLITQKRADYQLFKQAFELVNCKKHLAMKGLKELVAIKASMNNGLSDELKDSFPNITPVSRPIVADQEIQDPN